MQLINKVIHFHTMRSLSWRLCGRWSFFLVAFSLVCLPLSDIQNKMIALTEQGKNLRGKRLLSMPDGTVAAGRSHVTAGSSVLRLPRLSREWLYTCLARVESGVQKADREPVNWLPAGHGGTPNSDRITLACHCRLQSHPPFAEASPGLEKQLLSVSVTRGGWVQGRAHLGGCKSWIGRTDTPRGVHPKGCPLWHVAETQMAFRKYALCLLMIRLCWHIEEIKYF